MPDLGLSLRGARAVHVALLEEKPGRWAPLGLPIAGAYDRLGSIDGHAHDFRIDLLVAGLARMAGDGRLAARGLDEFAGFTAEPATDRLLRVIERANTLRRWWPVALTLDGRPLRQVLFHAGVFAAVAPPMRLAGAPDRARLADLLARSPVAAQARELYAPVVGGPEGVRAAAAVALAQLADCTRWLAARGRRWSPQAESGQYCAPDDLRFARDARTRLAAASDLLPVIDEVLAALERETGDR